LELNVFGNVGKAMKDFRKGILGALMDEYERAAEDLLQVLSTIDSASYEQVIDENGSEYDRSIQAIMKHVVSSGYGYANYLRKLWSLPITNPSAELQSRDEAIASVQKVLAYTSETLEDRWTLSEEETDNTTFVVSWGVTYNIEQILEHAVVHILRHRRQLQKILAT
jgi:uncharacterized damage-inducible protein DinB